MKNKFLIDQKDGLIFVKHYKNDKLRITYGPIEKNEYYGTNEYEVALNMISTIEYLLNKK